MGSVGCSARNAVRSMWMFQEEEPDVIDSVATVTLAIVIGTGVSQA